MCKKIHKRDGRNQKSTKKAGQKRKAANSSKPILGCLGVRGQAEDPITRSVRGIDNKLEILAVRKAHTCLNPVKGFERQ
jgi:hypothetical protein